MDVALLISSSGKSPELQNLIPHIDIEVPLIIMSAHLSSFQCPLFGYTNGNGATATPPSMDDLGRIKLHLSSLCHLSDEECIHVAAPTVSTCAALAVGDAFAVAVGKALHGQEQLRESFHRCHPGGDIGKKNRDAQLLATTAGNASDLEKGVDAIIRENFKISQRQI